MLYNIQGTKTIEIRYRYNNRRKSIMVGTPEPELLKEALYSVFSSAK